MGGPGAGRRFGHLILALPAALAGAAGLALEVLLIESAGLALGYGRSGAIGLAVFVAGWALGAYAAGHLRTSHRRLLGGLALLSLVLPGALELALLQSASRWPGSLLAGAVAVTAIGVVAFVQGLFLPLLLHVAAARRGATPQSVGWLMAANLAGAVAGAALGHETALYLGRVPLSFAWGALAALAATLVKWPVPSF